MRQKKTSENATSVVRDGVCNTCARSGKLGWKKREKKGLNKNSSFNYYGLLWRGHSVAGRASLPLGQGRGEPPGKLQGTPGKK